MLLPASWYDALPIILLQICTALKSDLGRSSAQLVYGTALRIHPENLLTFLLVVLPLPLLPIFSNSNS